ncbi:MAG: lasso peptide biosynthesis B2 protein [Cyanobacteria bacterium J06607_15]
MKKLLKLLRTGGKKLFLQTYVVMTVIRLGLLLLPFSRLQDLVLKSEQLTWLAIPGSGQTVRSIVLAVYRSGKYSPGNPLCLARALTTAVLMNIYGFPHQIEIGVAKGKDGKIEAHAWVTSEGKVIVGNLPDLSRYVPMSSRGKGLII